MTSTVILLWFPCDGKESLHPLPANCLSAGSERVCTKVFTRKTYLRCAKPQQLFFALERLVRSQSENENMPLPFLCGMISPLFMLKLRGLFFVRITS